MNVDEIKDLLRNIIADDCDISEQWYFVVCESQKHAGELFRQFINYLRSYEIEETVMRCTHQYRVYIHSDIVFQFVSVSYDLRGRRGVFLDEPTFESALEECMRYYIEVKEQ